MLLRNKHPEVREKWQAIADTRTRANKLARALHKVKPCHNPAEATQKPAEESRDPGEHLIENLTFSYMGCPLRVMKRLGGGTYSYVLQVQTVDKQHFACKVLKLMRPKEVAPDEELHSLKDTMKEATMHLRFVGCPYVVSCVGVATFQNTASLPFHSAALMMELCSSTVWAALRGATEKAPISEMQKMLWAFHIIAAISFIHSQKVVHLDLKLDNVMVGHDGRALLTDFGMARQCGADGQLLVPMNGAYAAAYRCPELTSLEPCLFHTCSTFFCLRGEVNKCHMPLQLWFSEV